MPTKRTYGDGCGMAHGLDLVGERWALLVVRELLIGPKRFTDIRAGLPNASPNVLSERLRELESVGVIARRKLPPPAASSVYELTEWGRGLEPVIMQLGRWALGSTEFPRDLPVGDVSIALGMRTLFSPELASDLEATIEFHFGDTVYTAVVDGGKLDLGTRSSANPEAAVRVSDPNALALLYGRGENLDEAIESGEVQLEGDSEIVRRFLDVLADPSALAINA